MPLFMDPAVHAVLVDALRLQVSEGFGGDPAVPDVIVGLDARGFLFGPGLALRLGVSFAPVRKKGKLPGPCVTAAYEKEYGTDLFQMQQDAISPGQRVLVVDDIIATGESAVFSSFPYMPASSVPSRGSLVVAIVVAIVVVLAHGCMAVSGNPAGQAVAAAAPHPSTVFPPHHRTRHEKKMSSTTTNAPVPVARRSLRHHHSHTPTLPYQA